VKHLAEAKQKGSKGIKREQKKSEGYPKPGGACCFGRIMQIPNWLG